MAKGRFTKLNLGPAEGKHRSVAGAIIIADYIDPITAQRTLVLERVASGEGKKPAKRKSNAAPKPAASSPATAFPGQDTANG